MIARHDLGSFLTQVLVVGGSLEATARTLDDFRAATAAPGWSEGNKRNWTIVVFGRTETSPN